MHSSAMMSCLALLAAVGRCQAPAPSPPGSETPFLRISVGFDDHGQPGPGDALTNPHVSYVTLGISWKAVNPQPGLYDWSGVDGAIVYYKAYGKKVLLRPVPYMGKAADAATNGHPDWIWEQGVEKITFPDKSGRPFSIPKCWDSPAWIRVYGEFITELARRYDGHPDVTMVWTGLARLGYMAVVTSHGQTEVLEAGWTRERWVTYLDAVTAAYALAFRVTPILFPTHSFFMNDVAGEEIQADVIAMTVRAARLGARVMLPGLDPDPAVWESLIFDDVVDALAGEALPTDFMLIGKDDWPLYGGAKSRTVEDFHSALTILTGEWEKLGRRGGLSILLLEEEVTASNPYAPGHVPQVEEDLVRFLKGDLGP